MLAVHARRERPTWSPSLRKLEWHERRGRACVFGRRSGYPARAAIRGRLGRRARQVAPCGRDLGHAAVRPSPRRASAPDGDDDAAADPAAEALSRRPARSRCRARGPPTTPPIWRRSFSTRWWAAMPARGSAARNSTARSSRIVPTRCGRAICIETAARRCSAAAGAHRRRGRSAGLLVEARRCLRHRCRRRRRWRHCLCAGGRDRVGA